MYNSVPGNSRHVFWPYSFRPAGTDPVGQAMGMARPKRFGHQHAFSAEGVMCIPVYLHIIHNVRLRYSMAGPIRDNFASAGPGTTSEVQETYLWEVCRDFLFQAEPRPYRYTSSTHGYRDKIIIINHSQCTRVLLFVKQ